MADVAGMESFYRRDRLFGNFDTPQFTQFDRNLLRPLNIINTKDISPSHGHVQ